MQSFSEAFGKPLFWLKGGANMENKKFSMTKFNAK